MLVFQKEDGFVVQDKFLKDVNVIVQYKSGLCFVDMNRPNRTITQAIVDYNQLIETIAMSLLREYKPRRDDGRHVPFGKMFKYLVKKLRPILYNAWKEQKQLCNQKAISLQQRALREIGSVPIILTHDVILGNKHFVNDFLTYRSFAAFASSMLYSDSQARWVIGEKARRLIASKNIEIANTINGGLDMINYISFNTSLLQKTSNATFGRLDEWFDTGIKSNPKSKDHDEILKVVENNLTWLVNNFFPKWRSILSNSGKSYKALNLTLDNYPGNCGRDIVQLSEIKLDKPIMRRREMLLAQRAATYPLPENTVNFYNTTIPQNVRKTWINATDEEIVRGIKVYNNYMERVHVRVYGRNANNNQTILSPRKNKSVHILCSYIVDALEFPEPITRQRSESAFNHHGKFPELVRKAIADHEVYQNFRTSSYDPNVVFPSPNFEVYFSYQGKKKHSIIHLSSVGDLNTESEMMQHCVRSYSQRCLSGYSFIYHVEYDGEHATAEFDNSGNLVQIMGHKNTLNRATSFGEKYLKINMKPDDAKNITLSGRGMIHVRRMANQNVQIEYGENINNPNLRGENPEWLNGIAEFGGQFEGQFVY